MLCSKTLYIQQEVQATEDDPQRLANTSEKRCGSFCLDRLDLEVEGDEREYQALDFVEDRHDISNIQSG